MSALIHMAIRSVRYHAGRVVVLALCIAVTVSLPVLSHLLVRKYQWELTARAQATPLVLGSKGNRYDLVLASLYFRRGDFEPLTMRSYRAMIRESMESDVPTGIIAVPMHVRFTARGAPIVATTPEYFEVRGLKPGDGSLPARVGEVTLGASVAASLGASVGTFIFSDQLDSFDISKPPSLKMPVVGVLARSGKPDDYAVFVDLKTAWVLEGVSHGHADAASGIPQRLVLDRQANRVSISEEMIEYNEITPETVGRFHLHADEGGLPLSAVLVFPADAKSATIAKARANASDGLQMVLPAEVIDELLAHVVRLRSLLDGLFAVMAVTAGSLMTLLGALSARSRAREFQTLHRIGCARSFVVRLFATEMLVVVVVGVVVAAGGVLAVYLLAPDAAWALAGG